MTTIKDIMRSTGIIKTSPETRVLDVIRLMYENKVGSVLITDGDKLVGVFTERELVRLVAEEKPLDIQVKEVMSRRLITAKPYETISLVASKMVEHWIRHIPVVDDENRVLGMVSIRDILRYMISSAIFP
ncbi:histidine kinase [Candidatus Geothermarchaeota archaeon]|nr:MAG: histidine kinase [Candidatus Geothermarchaeota archaeon]